MAINFPPLPTSFKCLQHYLKTAVEHDKRDPVVSYYCRLYAMQKGMEIDRKSPDCRNYLAGLMNYLEEAKKQHKEMEAIQNEIVGQAHLENYALKLFLFADNEDRAGRFGKNVVKSFYTAGMLMDVLTTFGEVSEDIEKNQKYAKWKAAYIHNCLKNGETPMSGPMPEDGDMDALLPAMGGEFPSGSVGLPQQPVVPPIGYNQPTPMDTAGHGLPPPAGYTHQQPVPLPRTVPAATPAASLPRVEPVPQAAQGGGVPLKTEDYTRAMKLCKFATSALQYEDSKTAIQNLTKALNLLTTGHE